MRNVSRLKSFTPKLTGLDTKYSTKLKELISQSREIAIDIGYDYISTIHFFLADCESKRENSILKFGFKSENEYRDFKKNYTLSEAGIFDHINDSLPLTKEAEITIKMAETERVLNKQTQCYPFHLFIAALKNKESFLFECFQNDKEALDKLIQYYKDLGEFEKGKMTEDEVSEQFYIPKDKSRENFLIKIGKLFTFRK